MKSIIYSLILSTLFLTGCASNDAANVVPATETAGTQASASANEEASTTETGSTANSSATNANLDQPSFTQGLAKVTVPELFACKGGRVTALGEIKSDDGKTWVVPSDINTKLVNASDMSNGCTNISFNSIADINLDDVPVIEIDSDGVIVTGYIFADNYFELYVNGKAVAKDAVPFTPFNSHVVRFKAAYPMTYAIKVVDWEENIGLGTEANKGNDYHPGDAGIVMSMSDGTVTDANWKAQNYYIAPLTKKSDLVVEVVAGKVIRSTAQASSTPSCEAQCYAAHFTVPESWYAKNYDDSSWPSAATFEESAVGVDNKSEYTNFASEFRKGKFIWSSNLILDNEVLFRHTVEGE